VPGSGDRTTVRPAGTSDGAITVPPSPDLLSSLKPEFGCGTHDSNRDLASIRHQDAAAHETPRVDIDVNANHAAGLAVRQGTRYPRALPTRMLSP
jgi:hypothetical protein